MVCQKALLRQIHNAGILSVEGVVGMDLIDRDYAIDDLHSKSQLQIWDTEDVEVWVNSLPSAEPERVWTPCDIPPKHHRDVIVRGVEAIGGECVYKVMQWDVDTWRPKNYAPSITWLDWSEI